MTQTNAERQRTWRERHIRRRRMAQGVANLLSRAELDEAAIAELAARLHGFFNRHSSRLLRRHLRQLGDPTEEDRRELTAHNTRTFEAAYQALEGEREDWERDHPGQVYPEHECNLSDREYTDLGSWRRRRRRKLEREQRGTV